MKHKIPFFIAFIFSYFSIALAEIVPVWSVDVAMPGEKVALYLVDTEVGEDLFLSTNDMNQAHKQMRENEHIQIVAKKPTSREWIRITGIATECDDKKLKQRMLEECPILQQRFGAVGMEHFIMFKVKVEQVEIK